MEVNQEILEDWFKDAKNKDAVLDEFTSYKRSLKKITEKIYQKFFGLNV